MIMLHKILANLYNNIWINIWIFRYIIENFSNNDNDMKHKYDIFTLWLTYLDINLVS